MMKAVDAGLGDIQPRDAEQNAIHRQQAGSDGCHCEAGPVQSEEKESNPGG